MSNKGTNLRNNPDSLTYYYMDNFLCNQYFLLNQECMQNYSQVWSVRIRKRRLMHKECLNYLDQYKACLIGINQQNIGSSTRKVLTDDQLQERKKQAINEKSNNSSGEKLDDGESRDRIKV